MGKHAIGGFTPFHFDISNFVRRDGTDRVALRVDNRPNPHTPLDPGPFDYILFTGIYCQAYLVQTDKFHLPFTWESRTAGLTITTPTVKREAATIDVKTTVRNEDTQGRECTLLTRVVDAEGYVVLRMESRATIPAGAEYTFSQVNGLDENVHLWSSDDPYLYRVISLLSDQNGPVDWAENPLGIRKFELRPEGELRINGVPTKLIGINRHQQFAYIGDAVPKSLHR